ncbi:MAG: alpha-L-fucosidase [Clostridia bacterium]|nr:alpha-L-fucosidase [Clostridia bacterium]
MTKDRTLWVKNKKWGIFVHYLEGIQNGEKTPNNPKFTKTSWNECVNDFDAEHFAKQAHDIGAGYVFFTLCQCSRFLCAPNTTYDEITGYKPGEACSERDLPMELADALAKYDIPLMLYFTGDGPQFDERAGAAFNTISKTKLDVDYDFVSKWTQVMQEYSIRYGKKVKGWWIDGSFDYIGYNDELMKLYRDAALAGNDEAIISFNNGVVRMDFSQPELAQLTSGADRYLDKLNLADQAARQGNAAAQNAFKISDTPRKYRYSEHEDYTAGEASFFGEIPESRFVHGSQWHALSFLGISTNMPLWSIECGWGAPGSRYSGDYMRDYISKVSSNGGVVSVDVFTDRFGNIDKAQLEVLKQVNRI